VRNLQRASVPRSVAMTLTGHTPESVHGRYAIGNAVSGKGDVRPVTA
jgi:hypothetical protein